MSHETRSENEVFENEVRRIARQLWPEAQYGGSTIAHGRERDGIFETEDCIHLIEATVSRSKEKATEDIKKLVALAGQYQKQQSSKTVKGWFITRDEPTAIQRSIAEKHRPLINALSFVQFQSRLIDAASYLSARDQYPFGSVRDPATGAPLTKIEYIDLDLIQMPGGDIWSLPAIQAEIQRGKRFVILGDYGAGKSTTLYELYRELKKTFFHNKTVQFPVYLNLRDHFGQTETAEILERHARVVGFAHPSHLVRAWRAGYVILLLDGFDEIATLGIQGLWRQLKEVRYRAMQAIRQFVREQPLTSGFVLSGRAHFFDSDLERHRTLNLPGDAIELTLNEFTDEQIQRYFEKHHFKGGVPAWMPSRPLLVGYLVASGLLGKVIGSLSKDETGSKEIDPAQGWDLLLDKVCQREAEIEVGIDGPTVRRILERLASIARATSTGVGPITSSQIEEAFVEICGYRPDEKGLVLIQRLPGLGVEQASEGTRAFIDGALADACMSGDVVAFVENPYTFSSQFMGGWEYGLRSLGVSIAANKLQKKETTSGKINSVLRYAVDHNKSPLLQLDIARVALELGCSIDTSVQFTSITNLKLELYDGIADCSNLAFRDCYFSQIELDAAAQASLLPRFSACYVGYLEGLSSERDLPVGVFDSDCVFERFSESTDTSSAIASTDLASATKVLLIVLRKLYFQSGSGRKENALYRGLDHNGRRLVGPVLKILQAEGFASTYKRGGLSMTIWVPDRSKTGRVGKLISAPHTCGDPLLAKVGTLISA